MVISVAHTLCTESATWVEHTDYSHTQHCVGDLELDFRFASGQPLVAKSRFEMTISKSFSSTPPSIRHL
jgi:hypothetical protein